MIALVLLFLGPVGTRMGVWGFQTGLLLIVPAGVLLAAIGLLVGLDVPVRFQKTGLRRRSAGRCSSSIAICAVIMVTMGMQFQKGASVPAIHNISTDVSDPPQFTQAIVELRGESSNPLEYDADELAIVQQGAYPDGRNAQAGSAEQPGRFRASCGSAGGSGSGGRHCR